MTHPWAEGTTVLAVEDDPLTARLIRARLEMEGLRVLEARNGMEGLAMYLEWGADLISSDLIMPAMDGFRLIQEIRALPSPKNQVPILILSVNRREADQIRCLAAGADDFMIKPLSPQMYLEKLWRLYARSRT